MKTANLKTGILSLTILLAIFASSNIYAQRMQRMNANQKGNRMMLHQNMDQKGMGMAGLNLSEEQLQKIGELRTKNLKEMLPITNEMQEKRAHLKTLTTAERVNQKEIDKVIDEIAMLTAKQMKAKIAHQQEMRSLLTEEQRVIFDSKSFGQGRNGFGRGNGQRGPTAMQPRPMMNR